MVARDEQTPRPFALPMAGFLFRWVAATVLPFWLCTASGLSFGLQAMWGGNDMEVPLGLAALVSFLAFPALLALGHWYVMRGLLSRPLLWGVLTGGGSVAILILLLMAFALRPSWLFWELAMARWLLVFGVPLWLLLGVVPFAIVGALAASVIAIVQMAALDTTWRGRLIWCSASAAAGVAALLWLWLCRELDLLREPMAAAASALYNDRNWSAMPVVTGWLASVLLVHALSTGVAMHRLLHRRHAAESAALAARFD